MTYQEHEQKLSKSIESVIRLIPLLKTSQQIDEVQAMLERLKAQLPVYSFSPNSGIFAQSSSSQCTGEGI